MKEKKSQKQLIFDLDTILLRKILGNNYRTIYDKIGNFLKKYGFEHIEGSGYMSKGKLSNTEVTDIIKKLKEKYPYLDKCMKNIHQANISNIHSLSQLFDYDGTIGDFSLHPDILKEVEREKIKAELTTQITAGKIFDEVLSETNFFMAAGLVLMKLNLIRRG